VFAEYQSAGRGRLGREWHAPRGASLLCTVLLWEDLSTLSPARLTLSTAVAASLAIETACHIEPNIRWPNDLYIASRKLGGILVEARSGPEKLAPVAIGIGINCLQHAAHFPPELRERATSLELSSSEPIDRARLAVELLRQLDHFFSRQAQVDDRILIEAWRSRSSDIGTHVTLSADGREFHGRIVDIHPTEGLVLQVDDGGRRHFDPSTTTRL
jgi:BirA family biotin operon repressor/biotin-[acetyl-CoA-carboxylase] ligase